jgi:hypothetical protein
MFTVKVLAHSSMTSVLSHGLIVPIETSHTILGLLSFAVVKSLKWGTVEPCVIIARSLGGRKVSKECLASQKRQSVMGGHECYWLRHVQSVNSMLFLAEMGQDFPFVS